ncbi:MAG: DUF2189 domain-containing protein [Rhizobiales bacterium]|nr:DUF2189 domain-containing protein [Hyphomicrobiales bacterium]
MANAHAIANAGESAAAPRVRTITGADIKHSLKQGWDDFSAMPSHAVFLCLIYPITGLILARLAFGYQILPLLYPTISGFALIGPVAAIGLYELSRRRERGEDAALTHAFDVFQSPSRWAVAMLGLMLVMIFFAWLVAAQAIYWLTFGDARPESIEGFLREVFTTPAGWTLIIAGNVVGFLFAVAVLTVSVVAFPLLLDRPVGAADAVLTSARAVLANPATMALWGLIVAVALLLGSLPIFLGLTVAVPVLGHATWHLYRKVVEPDTNPPQELPRQPKGRRYAADFPVALFTPTTEERR